MATRNSATTDATVRPNRLPETPVPPIPNVDVSRPDDASVKYSQYRTGLSNHRTGLSEHRTSLSEFRTDLSTHRTDLSTNRTEMSMRRTGMSFHRTRMSADRTLMSVIRTSLSLIGFGFTIAQFFTKLHQADVLKSSAAPKNFGVALVLARNRDARGRHRLSHCLHARLAQDARASSRSTGCYTPRVSFHFR